MKPILCYGSHIWGYQFVKAIEKVHVYFCKKVCYLPPNASNFFALGECGRLPLCTTYMSNCIKYWLQIIRMESHRYPKQCYYMLYELDESGKRTWASFIKDLLFTHDFSYAWIFQDVGNTNEFSKLFTHRIKDCYTQKWYTRVNESPKALHYKYFKSLLNPEFYLSTDLSYIQKRVLSNFRCSSQNLMIEKGRHLSTERDLRFCPICKNLNIFVIEDEYHFFFECKPFEKVREKYFETSWLRVRNKRVFFYSILECTRKNAIIKVAKYLLEAFDLRNKILQEMD